MVPQSPVAEQFLQLGLAGAAVVPLPDIAFIDWFLAGLPD